MFNPRVDLCLSAVRHTKKVSKISTCQRKKEKMADQEEVTQTTETQPETTTTTTTTEVKTDSISHTLPPHPKVSEGAANFQSNFHRNIVEEVSNAVKDHKVVVVGMSLNGFVKKAREALEAQKVPFKYLEFGGYLSMWQERLAIKMWSGWPTFPQVFVNGALIGGNEELQKLIADGTLAKMLE